MRFKKQNLQENDPEMDTSQFCWVELVEINQTHTQRATTIVVPGLYQVE